MILVSRRLLLQRALAVTGLGLLVSGCNLEPLSWRGSKRQIRIGLLTSLSAQDVAPSLEAFRDAIRDLGYVEGQQYFLEPRYAPGQDERLPEMAAELVKLPVDVILTNAQPALVAAKNATSTIPIVIAVLGNDPVALGLVDSLARPGGNVTGSSSLNVALDGKRLEILKQTLPGLTRVATLSDAANPGNALGQAESDRAALALGIETWRISLQSAADLDTAFDTALQGGAGAVTMGGNPFFQRNRSRIVELAIQHRLPSIFQQREFASAGGLMSYAANVQASFRRAARYVDLILKGSNPADLPIEQPTEFDFVINLKTAQALGLTFPPSVLAQASEIIQ